MKAQEAIDWIHERITFGSRPGLIRVQALLDLLNNPEKKITTIHIAGTNGKGSTVSFLRYLLEESGQKVGTFTSPHIEVFNERIAINGTFISDEDLVSLVEKIQPLVQQLDEQESLQYITQFEIITAMAFDYFYQEEVDVAIIEVGLGGLWDSTNVIQPILTGITTIGMDHMEQLGDTIEKIASHKAGIIKEETPVVTGNIVPEAMAVIEAQAQKLSAPIYRYNQEYEVTYHSPDKQWQETFDFRNEAGKIKQIKTSLLGSHQVENAGMAIQLYYLYCQLKKMPYSIKDIKTGIKETFWPARMERINEEPLIILDGAHNTHAMERLVENLKDEFKEYRLHILFSALETKDIKSMLQQLLTLPNVEIYLTTFEFLKAIKLKENYQNLDERMTVVSMWQFGLAEILEKMTSEDVLIVTGSLYFVSEVRELLQQQKN